MWCEWVCKTSMPVGSPLRVQVKIKTRQHFVCTNARQMVLFMWMHKSMNGGIWDHWVASLATSLGMIPAQHCLAEPSKWFHDPSTKDRRWSRTFAEMVGLHVNCVRIGAFFGPIIPLPASGKGVSCQQMDFGRQEGSHFAPSPLLWFCCFIGCVLCRWASYHVPHTKFGPSFSQILPIHCGLSATHWLDTRMAWDVTRLEGTSSAFG